MSIKIICGDSLVELKKLSENSVDSICCDPPYGLSFMGKKWDYDVPSVEMWKEALRVLKPGGHLLSFGGSRTYHRMAVAIEDAGFEIRDQIMYVYGSGFPKSLNIGKAVDKLQGNKREDLGKSPASRDNAPNHTVIARGAFSGDARITKGSSPYEGWGTALNPSHEPIVLARKPLSESTIALNVLRWGTGGINIDGCRVGDTVETWPKSRSYDSDKMAKPHSDQNFTKHETQLTGEVPSGRFPANFIHDGSDEVVRLFPDSKSTKGGTRGGGEAFFGNRNNQDRNGFDDSGSAARFFKTCKDTQKHAIMSVCNDINVNNVGSNLMISQLTEKIVKIHSVLKSATPNLDLLNQNLNALFVEQSAKNTGIDFVAKLVVIKEVPEDLVSQEELQAIQDFITNYKKCSLTQRNADAEKWESINITQITTNLLKLCGYVLSVTDKNTSLDTKEKAEQKSEHASFAYFPKASKKDRNEGLEGFEEKQTTGGGGLTAGFREDGSYETASAGGKYGSIKAKQTNSHPTVKPTALMQYLVRFVTPVGGTVLDCFMGSGSTGKACVLEGFDFIGIEIEKEYCDIATARIAFLQEKKLNKPLLI